MNKLLTGVQHLNFITSDLQHTVVSVPNKQVLNNVIDQLNRIVLVIRF